MRSSRVDADPVQRMSLVRQQAGPFEEAFDGPGTPRPCYEDVLDALSGCDLGDLSRRVTAGLEARGVTFGDGRDAEPFRFDPVPRVLTADEWEQLEAGLVQRLRALNAFVVDVYGAGEIIGAGLVPERVVASADHFEPAMRDVRPPPDVPIGVAGFDVVRNETGDFVVLEDNVRTPSGIAYAVAAREALDEHLPAPANRRAIDRAFDLLGSTLLAAAPDATRRPTVVVLTDGPENSAWYEHRCVAERLGLPLVRPSELEVRGDELLARIDGRFRRVDVVYRRTDEDRLTGDDGEPTGVARLLLEPCRAGTLACVNAFGTGVADDKLTHAYVEAMIRFYLDEEPLLRSVPTYDLGDDEAREALLARAHELVIKPRSASGGYGVVVGPHAGEHELAAAVAEVRERPEDFIAQETISLSRHPTVVGGRLEPRHVDLRAFAFAHGDDASVLPGGLTRVALRRGSLVVNSSQQGGGKDTWVLE